MPAKLYISEQALSDIKGALFRGDTFAETCLNLGYEHKELKSLCKSYGLWGWPRGAGARDQTGANNPAYTTGFSRSTVNRLTKKVLKQAGVDLFTCQRCDSKSSVEYPRHHIDRDRSNNEKENLEVLCHACHNREHMHEKERAIDGTFIT